MSNYISLFCMAVMTYPCPNPDAGLAGLCYSEIHIASYFSLLFWLQWRHYGRDGISNHQPHDCLLNRCFSDADQRKHQSSAFLAFVRGNHRGPVNSLHKWPVTRKMFPFDDVIMSLQVSIHILHGSLMSYQVIRCKQFIQHILPADMKVIRLSLQQVYCISLSTGVC